MTPERWQRTRELFDAALERSRSEADAFLRGECAEDSELLSEVRRLLDAQERTGPLDHPLVDHPLVQWATGGGVTVVPPVFAPGQLVAGRYRIVRYLSKGGMGEVYEAEHPLLPDHVALKTLLPGIAGDDSMIARFKQEIQLARKIGHANVCKTYDVEWHECEGAAHGRILFLTMELLAGETLYSRIKRDGRMPAAEALPLLEQMADALDAAHRCGIIHRDFKSSNVMLVPAGSGLRAVVTDFGLARSVSTGNESTATMTKNVPGTLDYMAPELLTGSVATFGSDIYALGVVAYEMVTGSVPFAGETPLAAAFLRARKPVPSPRTLVQDLDATWERGILRALDPDPGRRFSAVREFPKALRGEHVAKPRDTRRKLLAVAGMAGLLAAGWLGWRTWSTHRNQPPPEAARLYQQGVDDIHAGAYFAATKALDQAVRLAPGYSPARARLAESWLEFDLPEKAAREFLPVRRQNNTALPELDQLQIEALDLTLTGEFSGALAKYEAMRKLAGADAADLDIDLGRAYEKAGKPDSAIAAYRRAAEGPRHSAAAWLRLGVIYSLRKKTVESEEAFAEADRSYQISSNMEGLTELTLQRGVAANRSSRYPDAAALLRKALEHAHEAGNLQQEISAKLTLANVTYKAGDSALAESLAREALSTAQANQMESLIIRGFISLGSAYLGKGDLQGAEQHYRDARALALRTNSARLAALSQYNLANVYDRQHRSEDEIREAKDALRYFQANRWVQETFGCLVLLGRAEQYRGNFAAAVDSFQKLLDESTRAQDRANISKAQEGLGNALADQQKYPEALLHYQEFLNSSTDALHAGYASLDCAITLVRLGRAAEAPPHFARAEQAAGQYAELRQPLARYRAEMSLSLKEWAETIRGTKAALAGIGNLNPRTEADLTRLQGLAMLRSGDRRAAIQKCETAFASAQKLQDAGELLVTRLALLESRLAARDAANVKAVFQELEPGLSAHPESRWYALSLMARFDRQYADRAKQAMGELETLWGRDAFAQYAKRPDVKEIVSASLAR